MSDIGGAPLRPTFRMRLNDILIAHNPLFCGERRQAS
jgi:hypothetical protein